MENWLRNKNTLDFLGVWEGLYNPDFNSLRVQEIRNEAGTVRFTMSVKEWIPETGAIGLISKAGRYGGTYAHRDIAFEFGTRISARFKIILIREFQRLKAEEASRDNLTWSYHRFLSKVNYRLHTDAIKDHLLPKLQASKGGQWLIYADEADLLNVAVFGLTAKQWREANPELAKSGNMRDYADLIQLNVLANLESLNSVMIEAGTSKEKRFEILRKTAISQYQRLSLHQGLKGLEE
ncbi:MAG: KilA-N domain-containing protein [Bacteroidota bacterium]